MMLKSKTPTILRSWGLKTLFKIGVGCGLLGYATGAIWLNAAICAAPIPFAAFEPAAGCK